MTAATDMFWTSPATTFSVVFKYFDADPQDSYWVLGRTWGEADSDVAWLRANGYFYAQDALPETGTLSFPPTFSIRFVQP